MDYKHDDGGRKKAGYKGATGDCLSRALAIVTRRSYQEIYELVNEFGERERRADPSRARTGVYGPTAKRIAEHLGLTWTRTLASKRTGAALYLTSPDLPRGRIVVSLAGHYCAVINGVIHDTFDPSQKKPKRVYGYFQKKFLNKR